MKFVKIAAIAITISVAPTLYAFGAEPTIGSLDKTRDNVLTQQSPKYKSLDGSPMTSTSASGTSYGLDGKNLTPPPPPPPVITHLSVTDPLFSQRLFKGLKALKDAGVTGDDKNANFAADGQSLKCTSGPVKIGKEITVVSKCDFDVILGIDNRPKYDGRFAEVIFKAINEYSKANFSDELARISTSFNTTTAELTSQGFQQSQVQAQAPNQYIVCTKEVTPPPPPPLSAKIDMNSERSTASMTASAESMTPPPPPAPEIPPKYKCNLSSIFAVADKTKTESILEAFKKDEVWANSLKELDIASTSGDYKLYDTQIYQNMNGATKVVQAYIGARKADMKASDVKPTDTTISRYVVIYAQPKDRFDINNLVIKNIFVGQ